MEERTRKDDDLVAERFGCPHCGERDMDALVIGHIDEESITCTTCHTTYWLTPKEAK